MAFEHYDKCSLLLPMDGANNGTVFADWSANPKTVSLAGNPLPITSTAQSKYYGSSGLFGANTFGQQRSRIHATIDPIGTGPFTIACWTRIVYADDMGVIFDSRATDAFASVALNDNNFTFYVRGANKKVAFLYNDSGAIFVESSTNFPDSEFAHIAASRDDDNIVRVFLNGVIENSAVVTNNLSNPYVFVGANAGTSVHPNRNINDLIFLPGVALWTDDFTPPDRLIGELSNANAANPVEDESGTPVERRIFVVPRCYPTRMFTTESDSNGDFTLRAPATECSVFAIHEGDPIKNDIIHRVIPV